MKADESPKGATAALLASKGHTVVVLVILLALAINGAISQPMRHWAQTGLESGERVRLYATILATQWLLFWLVRFGIRRAGKTLRQVIDPNRLTLGRWAQCAAIAIGAGVLWMVVGSALALALRPSADDLRTLILLLPRSVFEKGSWITVSLSVGFCEEFLYRGYLLTQFRAIGGSLAAAVVFQAVLYGGAHSVLPMELVAATTVLGLLLGGLAVWRKSLVPGMILHAGIDIFGALFSSG